MSLDYSKLNWKHYREISGMTTDAIAEKCGISRQMLWFIENGQKNPSDFVKTKLLDLYRNQINAHIQFYSDQTRKMNMALIAIDKVSSQS